jgi:hypothetical protein
MKRNRLDAVLTRNRKHMVLDVALAAFFLMALLFSGFAFGAQVPKLNVAVQDAPAVVTPAAQGAQRAGNELEPEATSPQLAYH